MRRTVVGTVIVGLSIVAAGLIFSYCSSDIELKPETPKIVEIDHVKAKGSDWKQFTTKYETFIDALTDAQRTMLSDFVSSEESKNVASKTNDVTCTCTTGQNSCSASTWFSSCCVCWDAGTHNGMCGSYGFVASCKIELKKVTQTRTAEVENLIDFYPKRFSEMLV